MQLGKTIKSCRKIQGYTLDKLASECDLSPSYLSLVEQGKREPSLSSLQSICDALKISLNVLLFLAAKPDEISELDSKSVNLISEAIESLLRDVSAKSS